MNLRTATIAAFLAAFVYLQPYRPIVVSGDSMNPTLADGQWILGARRPPRIARGDVVVFRRGSETCVKRVVCLPGDGIEQYRLGDQWIVPSNERARASLVRQRKPRYDLVVPAGHLYVVGDNLYGSVDSRTYGPVPTADVVAVVPKAPAFTQGWYAPAHATRALMATL